MMGWNGFGLTKYVSQFDKKMSCKQLIYCMTGINQNNFSEKNNQVRLMAKIYTNAQLVYVWLGDEVEEDPDIDQKDATTNSLLDSKNNSGPAIKFIKKFIKLDHFDTLVRDKDMDKEWDSMVALMKRTWFSRRWVVQEIALAKNAVMLCGEHRIEWFDFADAVSLFNDVEAEKQTISRAIMRKQGYKPRYFGYVQALSATRLVEVTNDLFRRRADKEQVALLSLEQLVSTFTSFNASEPRDTIYSLLAIAKDTIPRTSHANMRNLVASYAEEIQERFIEQLSRKIVAKAYYVNYEQPVSDVFVDFVEFSISQSDPTRALDIICRPWAPVQGGEVLQSDEGEPLRAKLEEKVSKRHDGLGKDTVPSWIPSIEGAAYGLEPKSKVMVRINPDTLVGIPPDRNYTAAGSMSVTKALRFEQGVTRFSKYKNLNDLHYHSMFVEGFIVDTVDIVKTASRRGDIPKDWARLGGQRASKNDQWPGLPEEYWRTLVADRGKNGNPPRHYPRLINQALSMSAKGDAFDTQRWIDHPDCQVVSDVLERVQSVIWNRRLIRTGDGRLGLVPEYTKKGDLIAILYGCSVPVVLRRFTKTVEEQKEEIRTKFTRQQKIAARNFVRTMRKKRTDQQSRDRQASTETQRSNAGVTTVKSVASIPGFQSKNGNTTSVATHDFGNDSESPHAHIKQHPVAHDHGGPIYSLSRASTSRDPDTISISSQQSLKVPGAWPKATPPVSRQGTDIVAPGPIPDNVLRSSRTTTSQSSAPTTPGFTANPTQWIADKKAVVAPALNDEYSFYQIIGECYLHGMMNGEAIPKQLSAEEEAKQKTAQDRETLQSLKKAAENEKEMGTQVYYDKLKSLKRASTAPAAGVVKSETPPGPIEPTINTRYLFELR
jgi:hypothetical protein